MKHVAFLLATIVLALFGTVICVTDVYRSGGGELHLANAVVGFTSLLLAIAFAVPLRMQSAIGILTPFLDRLRQNASGRNVG